MDVKIDEKFVLNNYEAKNKEEVIMKLANILLQEGVVKDSFLRSVLEREKRFPTGLPTEPVKIAIPHTDAEHCNSSAIAVATLTEPVRFGLMGDDKETVDVRIIFLLALNKKEEQAIFLSKFSQFICDSKVIEEILLANDSSYVASILKDRLCN
ncbi:PTS sugar transporter subunit IIA [Calorimonas adulescens]|jgi:Phosphoenolpyruvate-dependent sugar phosphotransferase system, EIIA 2.|uniref:PTS sugar transporter subunit IIA n=1 Tax=Calorimonas adulescens TaxID=2606906 RepID=A0A5D8QA72_9THEO|nr:PTS sugar transporter subunit IIA [Calorimonas adulescens]TZE81500.1 PTS sugar transporter subunit IIA [Calorimonas adulescens]